MKRTLNLTWGFVGCLLFSILCLSGLIMGIYNYFNMRQALDINDFNVSELSEGMYLKGEIGDYLINANGDGQSGVFLSLIRGEMPYYTIKDNSGRYIALMLTDFHNVKAMEDHDEVLENPVYIEAKVTTNMNSYNHGWYKTLFNAQSDEEVAEKVINTITLEEVDFGANTKLIQQSLVLFIVSVIVFYYLGGLKEFFKYEDYTNKFDLSERKFREVKAMASYVEDINYEYEIRRQRVNLEVLRKKKQKIRESAKFGFIYLGAAAVSAFIASQLNVIALMILTVVFLVLALKTLFILFLNSESLLAINIANTLGLDTVRKEIMMAEKSIKELQNGYRNLTI